MKNPKPLPQPQPFPYGGGGEDLPLSGKFKRAQTANPLLVNNLNSLSAKTGKPYPQFAEMLSV